MLCPNCGRVMNNIMHFENGKQYQYNECKHCLKRTKNKRIHFDDVIIESNNKGTCTNYLRGKSFEKKTKKNTV